ncbi:hypothetical protein EJ994_10640 [Maribacter sp. MJ134]|jgi:hypothetical protein|uniref:DUF7009 family protein n=1 Tax=Maribacter sp. MJ134 TaxID=2496865 RepID=UPI000F83BC28|nr:hypothetical protein EJ994_10640 [Maribacter sp. MJ134]
MKIRIRGNSIRYRLTKSEVETFCATGRYEESTNFGNSVFTYVLEAKEATAVLDAEFKDNTITLFMSKEMSVGWYASNEIGFRHTSVRADNSELSLLVEKDFVCMDETIEDQSDNYPNPKA